MLSEAPEGWSSAKLAELLKGSLFTDGDWVESKDQSPDGEVRLIQLADIGDGKFIDKSDRHLTKDAAKRLNCTFLREGDLLVARMPEPLGRCCRFPLVGEEQFVTVVDVAILRPNGEFNASWLMNLMNSSYARKYVEGNASGTTRKRISRKNLAALQLLLPPLTEQKRIAEVLSSVDESIQATQRLIEQAERVKQGLMEELLTGGLGSEAIERGEVPEGWIEHQPLACYVKNITTKWDQVSVFPYIGLEHIAQGKGYLVGLGESVSVSSAKNAFVNKDVLFGKLRPNLKKYWFADFSGICSTDILVLRAKAGLDSRFLYWLVQSNIFTFFAINDAAGTKMPRTSWKRLSTIQLPIPQLEMQQEAASMLDSVAESISEYEKSVVRYQSIKKGLMDDLLTGKVRTV